MPASAQTAPADEQTGTTYHWVMTVQIADGRQATNDGVINVVPGAHTRQSTYTEVLRAVKDWVRSDSVTVLFYDVQPNQF